MNDSLSPVGDSGRVTGRNWFDCSPSSRETRTVHTEPDFTRHLILWVAKPHPRAFELAEFTEPFLRMLRAEPRFPCTVVRGRFPSATGGTEQAWQFETTPVPDHS